MSRKHLRSSRRSSRCSGKWGNIHRDPRTAGHTCRQGSAPLGTAGSCWDGSQVLEFFGKHRQVGRMELTWDG